MKIYTRTGDRGETSLLDGSRVRKSDPRVEANGALDELNAWLGFARAGLREGVLADTLMVIQRDLFALGARLADPHQALEGRTRKVEFGTDQVARLEREIDRLEGSLPPLRQFILAGGSTPGATLHLARTVCRRAERRLVSLTDEGLGTDGVAYLNRLSDLLFVMARAANRQAGLPEIEW